MEDQAPDFRTVLKEKKKSKGTSNTQDYVGRSNQVFNNCHNVTVSNDSGNMGEAINLVSEHMLKSSAAVSANINTAIDRIMALVPALVEAFQKKRQAQEESAKQVVEDWVKNPPQKKRGPKKKK